VNTRLTALLLLIGLLTACQNVSDTNERPSPSSQLNKRLAVKGMTLNFMHMGRPSDEYEGKTYLMKTFPNLVNERFPELTITTELLPDDQYVKTLYSRLASGNGPDFFEWWPKEQLRELVDAGYVSEINDAEILKYFDPEVLDGFTVDGKVYGLPKGLSIMGTWYNKDLFQQAGIDTLPQDWPSFLAACEKLQARGITPIVMPDKDAWFIQFGLYQIAASVIYPEVPDYDTQLRAGSSKFTDPKWIETLAKYKLLYDKEYVIPNSLHLSGGQATNLFIDGQAAMMFNGNWAYPLMTAQGTSSFERGFFPLPGNDEGQPLFLSVAPAGGTVISSHTKYYKEILQVLAYQFEGDSPLAAEYKETYRYFPRNVADELPFPEFSDYLVELKHRPRVYFSNQAWPVGVADEMCLAFQDMLAGQQTVEGIAEAMERKLRQLLAKDQS